MIIEIRCLYFLHSTVHNWASRRDDQLNEWVKSVSERRGKHKAVVALANKTARMVWVVLNKGVDALLSQKMKRINNTND